MSVSQQQLISHAAKALSKALESVQQTDDRATDATMRLAYAWSAPWGGDGTITLSGRPVDVHACASELAVREALVRETDHHQLLLVGIPDTTLSDDVRARIYQRRLLHVDRWEVLAGAMNARQIDPRLYAHEWIVDSLLEAVSVKTPPARALLTFDDAIDMAMASVLGDALGGETDSLTLPQLITQSEAIAPRWKSLPDDARHAFQQRLVARLGIGVGIALQLIEADHAWQVLPVALVCEVVCGGDDKTALALRDARIRLEKLGIKKLDRRQGMAYAEAGKLALQNLPPSRRSAAVGAARQLIDELEVSDYLPLSSTLPDALNARLDAVAQAIMRIMRAKNLQPSHLQGLEAAVQLVGEHCDAHQSLSAQRLPHVARLARRYVALRGEEQSDKDSLNRFVQHTSWALRAARPLSDLHPDSLAKAAAKLLAHLQASQLEDDQRFAEDVLACAHKHQPLLGTIRIENAIDQWIAPLAKQCPILLIVLDGMSWDAYLELEDSVRSAGWTAWQATDQANALLATTPSTTECSRMSLFGGTLAVGNSAKEKKAFAAHPALLAASAPGRGPILLHKHDLTDGGQLSPTTLEYLQETRQQIVAVVINAIDDALSKSDQVHFDWSTQSIPLLHTLLQQAESAGRTVVVTADHGHVLERGSTLASASEPGGERWRTDDRAVEPGELLFDDPRTSKLNGRALVLPYSSRVRYAKKKAGYHGGVSQQELLVPIAAWTRSVTDLEGYVPAPQTPPTWWTGSEPVSEDTAAIVAATTKPSGKPKRKAPSSQAGLFEEPSHAPESTSETVSWIEQLLSSQTLKQQRERIGRSALDDERLRRVLTTLHQRGGRATLDQLSVALKMPPMRLRGLAAVLERMLNIDGYPVVQLEADTGTVRIDRALLREQFEL